MATGMYQGLSVATLTAMLARWEACLDGISVGGQSYSMAGRTFTRADLPEVGKMVDDLSVALQLKNGGLCRTVYSDFSC